MFVDMAVCFVEGGETHSTTVINYAVCDLGKYSMMTFGLFAMTSHTATT